MLAFLCALPASAQQAFTSVGVRYEALRAAPTRYSLSVQEKPPPFKTGRVVKQIALGTALGVVGGYAGGAIGVYASDCPNGTFLCGLGGALLGGSIGLMAGSALGATLAGRTDNVEISFGRALLGSGAGLVMGILVAGSGLVSDEPSSLAFIPLLMMPAVGAALIGNGSRRYRTGAATGGLLHVEDGELRLGMPAVQRHALGGVPRTSVRLVRLLEVRW